MWLDIIKTIIDISTKKKEIENDKRLKLSEIFLQISELLDSTSDNLENGIYPMGSCFKMTSLAEEFLLVVKDKMDEDKWRTLSNMLYESCRLEREYANRENKETLKTIRETAANFYTQSLIFKLE